MKYHVEHGLAIPLVREFSFSLSHTHSLTHIHYGLVFLTLVKEVLSSAASSGPQLQVTEGHDVEDATVINQAVQ